MVGSEIQHVTQTARVNIGLSFGLFSRGWCQSTELVDYTALIISVKTDMELGSAVSTVRSKRVLLGDEIRPAVIVIKDGKIHEILPDRDFSGAAACEVSWHSLVSVYELICIDLTLLIVYVHLNHGVVTRL